ncbi:reverse transcriptase domain-containing protein [Tanacetum coccineum]
MLERLAGNKIYCFLDGFSGYFQISIDPQDQEKTTFTCPYGTFAYRRMPFGLCNAPGIFQRCMMAIFHDMIEKTIEVFMDDFLVFRDSFSSCLSHLDTMLQQCEDTNLVLNWEKCHFIVKEGIVLGHKISKDGLEVDRAKVDVIAKLLPPTTVKGVRSFLGHAGFYRSFTTLLGFLRDAFFFCEFTGDFHSLEIIRRCKQEKQAEQEEPAAQSFLLNWNFPMADDDEYTIIYRKPKAITPDLPAEEPDNSLSMGDEHLNTIPETEKSSVENLVPIPSESKGISDDICDVPSCDNDHFDAEFGLINSLLNRDISITSPKIDFLPEEFAGELDLIDPILPGIDDDDFDEEEGEIDIDILQIEDEILREKLLNVNLLIDKIEALNLTPSIPFVLEYPSSSPISVVDSDFLIEEVDTFLVPEDSIPPGIESDFDSEGDIIFSNDLLNDDPIPEYERFTFDIEPDAPVINNFDELNEDECFDPGGGEIDVS